MINTTSKAAKKGGSKKVQYYKGIKVQSQDDHDENSKSSDGESSKDSAEEYFNNQRKMIKNRLLGDRRLQNEFEKEDYASVNEEEPRFGNEPTFGEGDEDNADMQEFDRMMQASVSEAQRLQEEEQARAREEQERARAERLRHQEERLKQD